MKTRDIDVIVGRLRRQFTDADSYVVLMTVIACAEQLGDADAGATSADRLELLCRRVLNRRALAAS